MTAVVYALPMFNAAPVVQTRKTIPSGAGVANLATRRAAKNRKQAKVNSLRRMQDEVMAVAVRLGDEILALDG